MTRKQKNTRELAPVAESGEDVALLCGASADGTGVNVLRKRGQSIEAGVLRPMEEGKPLAGEVVQLRRRGNTPLCDVTVCYSATTGALPDTASAFDTQERRSPVGETAGAKLEGGEAAREAPAHELGRPPRVASDEYRRNWDAIWKPQRGEKKYIN